MGEDIRQTVLELEEKVSELKDRVEKLSNVIKLLASAIVVVPQELVEVSSSCRSVVNDFIDAIAGFEDVSPDLKDRYRKMFIYMLEVKLLYLKTGLENSYSMLSNIIKSIEEVDSIVGEALDTMVREFIGINLGSVVEVILSISREIGIDFEELAKTLVNSLGKDLAKNIVDLNSIKRYYGDKAVQLWRKTLES